MKGNTPAIYVKNTGVHCVKWGGKEWSFTKDRKESEKSYLDPGGAHPGALVHWVRWRRTKADAQATAHTGPTVAELAAKFISDYSENGRDATATYYRSCLKRFIHAFGHMRAVNFSVQAFDAFRRSLLQLDLAPRTIVHDLKAVKTMWLWGHPRALCPPIDFRGVKLPRVARSAPEPVPVKRIIEVVQKLEKANPTLAAWVAFNYLTGARPSEVVRVASGQGQLITLPPENKKRAIPDAAIELIEHKTAHKTQTSRYILLSKEALMWLPHVKLLPSETHRKSPPRPQSVLNRYGKLLRLAGHAGLPHKLRDSAATHLLAAGVDQGAVDLILGHAPTGELASYGLPPLRVLREKVALLSLKSNPK